MELEIFKLPGQGDYSSDVNVENIKYGLRRDAENPLAFIDRIFQEFEEKKQRGKRLAKADFWAYDFDTSDKGGVIISPTISTEPHLYEFDAQGKKFRVDGLPGGRGFSLVGRMQGNEQQRKYFIVWDRDNLYVGSPGKLQEAEMSHVHLNNQGEYRECDLDGQKGNLWININPYLLRSRKRPDLEEYIGKSLIESQGKIELLEDFTCKLHNSS